MIVAPLSPIGYNTIRFFTREWGDEMIQVFISYKHHEIDGTIAQKLYDLLRGWGFGVWMDKHKIPSGITQDTDGWIESIDEGLRTSQVLIGLISQESLESKNVQREWKWMRRRNRRIFLIKLRDFNEDFLSHQFDEALYLNYPDGLSKLETELSEFAEKYDKFTESVTVKERNLNAEILKDLDTLASQAPQITPRKRGKHDPIIGGDTPTEDDWKIFKDRTRRYWLESLLRPTLQEAAALNIGLSTQPDMVIQHEELGEIDLSGGSMNVRGIFDALRSFLIVGDAGAGKTVMLLQLATKLLINPIPALRYRLPLLLNLSSWGNDDIPLEDWLLQEAETTYQIREKTFIRWLADDQLILLLDGLDEIRADEADRRTLADRIQKINAYRQAHPDMPMVICTRINEYRLSTGDKAENKLNFDHAIKVDPLTEAQIQAYMDAPDLTSLRELYAEDAIVRDLAKIPFLLVTMTHTYRDLPKRQLEIENNTIPDRLDHLFRKYLTKQLQSHTPLRHSEEKIREYLTWIATKTTAFGTVFNADKVTIEWFRGDEDVARIYEFARRRFIPNFLRNIVTHRLILTKLPHDYNQLVHELTARQILRPFGGGHTFRHDYLRQSFFGNSKIVMAQIELLINDLIDWRINEDVLDKIVKFGGVAVDPLIAHFSDTSFYVCFQIAGALKGIGDVHLEPLTAYLGNLYWDMRYQVGWSGKDVVEHLTNLLDTSNSYVRYSVVMELKSVVMELKQIGDVRAVEPLIACLDDNDSNVRSSVVEVLGEIGDTRAVEPLIARLDDNDGFVRYTVVKTLGEIGDTRAVEPLIARLSDERHSIAIVEALGEIGDTRAVEPLIARLDDVDSFERRWIAKALGRIGDKRAVNPLIAHLGIAWSDIHIVEALGEIGDKRAVEPLINHLGKSNNETRKEIIRALYKIATPETLEALRKAGFKP